ncbi:hypothetical protein N7540_010817 [Penicillium herquei]|nr:hypothetical protein N7540_010817 [Penicillium herquei]
MFSHHREPGAPCDFGGNAERWLNADRARQLGLTEWGNPDTTGWSSDLVAGSSLPKRELEIPQPGSLQAGTDAPSGQECTRRAGNRCAFDSCAVLVFDGDIAFNGSFIACAYGDVANRCSNRSQLPQFAYDLVAAENPDHPILQLPANATMARTAQPATTQTVMEYQAPGPVTAHVDQDELEALLLSSDSSSLSSLGTPTPNSAADSDNLQNTA